MIELIHVSKSFTLKGKKVLVLDDISLEIKKGEIFGIIGKSGAGKSTLIRCMNLLEVPDSGAVVIDGADIIKLRAKDLRNIRHEIGMIFQGFNLLSAKNIFDNVALPLLLQGKHSKAEIKTRVLELLNLVGLADFLYKYPKSLSGGQRQRVGIARALATNPEILLCDEATSALDTETTNSILELLLKINEDLGVTIVLITHEIDVVRKICDRVAILDKGHIIEVADTIKVILHPREPLTRKLILEEEIDRYLELVQDFYQFNKSDNNHLVLLSFMGDQTFEPIISRIGHETGVEVSILRGELGRIKRMPFGQLLLEIKGDLAQLVQVVKIFENLKIHFEVIDHTHMCNEYDNN